MKINPNNQNEVVGGDGEQHVPAVRSGTSGVIRREEIAAERQAREIVARAERDAWRLRQQAQEEAELLRHQAEEDGRQRGLAELTQTLLDFDRRRAELIERNKEHLISLAVRIAERILNREVRESPDTLEGIMLRAFSSMQNGRRFAIRVHPECMEAARGAEQRLRRELASGAEIVFREDASVEPGGCVIDSELGTVDAQLATQLRVIEKLLDGGGES